jgi:hypothetical protein
MGPRRRVVTRSPDEGDDRQAGTDHALVKGCDGSESMPQHRYEIRLRGRLTPTMASEFEQLELNTSTAPVDTLLEGTVDDGAALHGLLRRIEALGLELVEVRRLADAGVNASSAAGATSTTSTTSRADEP